MTRRRLAIAAAVCMLLLAGWQMPSLFAQSGTSATNRNAAGERSQPAVVVEAVQAALQPMPQVLTAVGTNRSPPAFVVAMAQALRDMADLPINLASTNPVNCGGPSDGTVTAFPMGGSDYAIKLSNCKTSTGCTLFGGEALEVLQSFTSTSPDNVCPPGNVVTPLVVGPPLVPGVCKWPTEVKYTTLGANRFRIFVNTATATGNGTPDPVVSPSRFVCAESLGGVESLAEHPAIMTHASVPREAREAVGIGDGLLRLSVGIEDVADLLDDLDRGSAAARALS